MRHLARNGHETLVTGQECINAYIERNTEYEIQKAFVIQAFITSILTWKLGILDAIQNACSRCYRVLGMVCEKMGVWIFAVNRGFSTK